MKWKQVAKCDVASQCLLTGAVEDHSKPRRE